MDAAIWTPLFGCPPLGDMPHLRQAHLGSQTGATLGRMPNPRFDRDRGTCHTCTGNGGTSPGLPWAVVCLRPKDSGKEISRMPETGCCYWQGQYPGTKKPVEAGL